MEFEDLKNIWLRQQNEPEPYSETELLKIVDNKMSIFDKKIRWRDRLEMAAAVLIIIIFGIFFFDVQSVWTKLGCLIIIISAISIGYKLIAARRNGRAKAHSFDQSIHEQLQEELQKVEIQKKLLKNVLWWYLLPIFGGLAFFSIGMEMETGIKVGYLVAVSALCAWIWKINQAAVSNKLDPIIKNIKAAIYFIEEKPK